LPGSGEDKEDIQDVKSITKDESRVLRGGSFGNQASFVRSANRVFYVPTSRLNNLGFRLARTLPL
jgi:formylglycine-generating enzyme required for sulfatase activity